MPLLRTTKITKQQIITESGIQLVEILLLSVSSKYCWVMISALLTFGELKKNVSLCCVTLQLKSQGIVYRLFRNTFSI